MRALFPIYYNFGAVLVPRRFLPDLAAAYVRQLVVAENADVGYFVGQLALTLAIYAIVLNPDHHLGNAQ
jgi:hypothetical protein